MAINKNFVIKNGVQVSTDLIIGDTDTNKVGIGTTVPHYDLHVGVARGSRGGIGVTDAVVAGVATINQLSVTGISTFAGALDVNSTVDFAGDVVFNGTNDITYDQSESALVFNDGAAIRVGTSSDFSIMHDGNNTILRERGTGALKILSNSVELLGATAGETLAKFNENGNVELYHDNTKHFEVVAIGATVFGDLTISGVTTSKELNVSSGSTFGGLVDANAGAHIDNLRLGIDADNDITTSSGNLTLDSAGGTVEINDNLQVDGQTDLNGDINLGNATSDTITATGRFDSDLVPSTNNARDLGASSLQFKDLYVDGVGYIDSVESDGGSFGNIQVGETGDNEIDTASLNLILDSAGGTINIDDNITVAGVSTFSGIGSFGTDMNVGITTFFVDKSTGRVGVGTNVPTATLEIGKTAGTGIGVSIHENGNAGFTGIVTVGSAIKLGDDRQIRIGNDNDLTLSHSGSNANIENDTGDLIIRTTGASSDDIFLDSHDDINLRVHDTINAIVATGGGSVDLYYSGSKKVETTSGGLNVTGITTISDRLQVTSGISTFYDTTQSSSATTGAVIINGGVGIAKNLNVGGNLTVTGTTTFNGGTLTLGDANTDNIVFGGEVDSNIIPDDDNTHDLGSSSQQWKDIYIHGVGYIDSISADTAAISDLTDNRVVIAGSSGELEDDANLTFDGTGLRVGTAATIQTGGQAAFAGIVTANGGLSVGTNGSAGVAVSAHTNGNFAASGFTTAGTGIKVNTGGVEIAAGGANITGELDLVGHLDLNSDSHKIKLGAGDDFQLYHNGTDNYIETNNGDINITTTGDDINITAADDVTIKVQGSEAAIEAKGNAEVILYHNANARITTTDDGADIGGTGALAIPKGAESDRPGSPAVGDFRYNTDDNQFEGYTDEGWGAIAGSGGGATEVDTSVSTTSATSTGSFAKASFRSASIIAQITQGSAYQVGRYLLIHDGTTVTTIEESAIATGSMLGTFEGVINGSNVEFRVTMGSSSSATVTTKIDTVTV